MIARAHQLMMEVIKYLFRDIQALIIKTYQLFFLHQIIVIDVEIWLQLWMLMRLLSKHIFNMTQPQEKETKYLRKEFQIISYELMIINKIIIYYFYILLQSKS